MQNFIQKGDTLTIPSPSNVASGEPVIAGSIVGIASSKAVSGESVDVVTSGVFELQKVAANSFDVGSSVYWNATDKLATSTASTNTKLGVAIAEAAASTALVQVRLSGF